MARTWLELKSEFFLGPKNPDFGPKIRFFSYGTPFFGKGALVTLGVSSVLAPSDLLCDFLFPSYAVFVRGPVQRAKKSYPTPLWGHRLPVTALALSARRPFGPARFARGLDKIVHANSPSDLMVI